jgi:hypothetical protein
LPEERQRDAARALMCLSKMTRHWMTMLRRATITGSLIGVKHSKLRCLRNRIVLRLMLLLR